MRPSSRLWSFIGVSFLILLCLTGCSAVGESQTLVIYVPPVSGAPQPTVRTTARLTQVPEACMVRLHTTQGWVIPVDTPLPPNTGILLPVGGRVPPGWGSSPYNGPQQQCTSMEWQAWFDQLRAQGIDPTTQFAQDIVPFMPIQENDPIFLHLPPEMRRVLRIVLGGGLMLVWGMTVATFFSIQVMRTGLDGFQYRDITSDPGPLFGSVLWVGAMLTPIPFISMLIGFLAHFISTRRTSWGAAGGVIYMMFFVVIILVLIALAILSWLSPVLDQIIRSFLRALVEQGDRLYMSGFLWAAIMAIATVIDREEDYSGNAALCILAGAICILWGWVPFLPPSMPQITPFLGFVAWTSIGASIYFFESTERHGHLTWRKDPLLLVISVAILTLGCAAQYGRILVGAG